ncbi:MAG TPA: tetratricopeptide repeat protein, partial [Pirellulaceae bacterium]|nr:tetratricopeptide repeat protein [Pirellulaceae bacterium]
MIRKQGNCDRSRARRLLFVALLVMIVLGAMAYRLYRNSATALAHIRELGRQDPIVARELLEAGNDRSRDAQLLRCQLLAAVGSWNQAEEVFDDISKPELCRQHELIELASLALTSGIYSLANIALDAAYRQGNADVELLRTMISVKHQLEANQDALALCDEMSRRTPGDPYPWLVSATIYQEAEKIDFAIRAYREALRRSPDKRDAQNARFQVADLAIYAGDLPTARQQLDLLLTEPPAAPSVLVLYAKLLHREGDLAAGVKILSGVLASNPDMVPALLERGTLYLELEKPAEAVRDFDQVVTLDPESYTGHYKLGLAYQKLNQPEVARRHLERSGQSTDRMSKHSLQNQRTTQGRT